MWFFQMCYPTGCQKCQKPPEHPSGTFGTASIRDFTARSACESVKPILVEAQRPRCRESTASDDRASQSLTAARSTGGEDATLEGARIDFSNVCYNSGASRCTS